MLRDFLGGSVTAPPVSGVVQDAFRDPESLPRLLASYGSFKTSRSRKGKALSASQASVLRNERGGQQLMFRKELTADEMRNPVYLPLFEATDFDGSFRSALGAAAKESSPTMGINIFPPVGAILPAHNDIPSFLGVEDAPNWLKHLMLRSGLFQDSYIPCLVGLFWTYTGRGGGFRFWPNGPQEVATTVDQINNKGWIGDSNLIIHQILPVGNETVPTSLKDIETASIAAATGDGERWVLKFGDTPVREYSYSDLRVTFAVRTSIPRNAGHALDTSPSLSLAYVFERFIDDLISKRKVEEAAKLDEEAFVQLLDATYPFPALDKSY